MPDCQAVMWALKNKVKIITQMFGIYIYRPYLCPNKTPQGITKVKGTKEFEEYKATLRNTLFLKAAQFISGRK